MGMCFDLLLWILLNRQIKCYTFNNSTMDLNNMFVS